MDRALSYRFRTEADRYWHDKVSHPRRCCAGGPIALLMVLCIAALV